MTAPGPTTAYHVHRAVLTVIVLIIILLTSYLVVRGIPSLRQWVISAIDAVQDEWTSWDWRLL